MRWLFLSIPLATLFSVSAFAQDAKPIDQVVYTDKAAYNESKQIKQIVAENCEHRLTLNRSGTMFLVGKTKQLKEGSYRFEFDSVEEPVFDLYAYLVEKLDLMELPDLVEGDWHDLCHYEFEFLKGSQRKRIEFNGITLLPELSSFSLQIDHIIEIAEWEPFLPEDVLKKIRLEQIPWIAPKGRVQDPHYNRIKQVEYLLSVGKPSIPFLIEKLDDETKIDHQVLNYWYNVYVGDMALVILTNFFKDRSFRYTVKSLGWDTFLERKNRDQMSEEVLRDYIDKHGRMKIKERWLEFWKQNKDRIELDRECNCFRLTEGSNER